MRRTISFRSLLILSLALVLAAGTAFAATNLMSLHAVVNDEKVAPRGNFVNVECFFGNTSKVDTVETTLSAVVRFADGFERTILEPETQILEPDNAQITFATIYVDEDAALGTAVWICRAESTVVGGPGKSGRSAVDTDADTFEVVDVLTADSI